MAIRESTATAKTSSKGSIDEVERRALRQAFEKKRGFLEPRSEFNPYDGRRERSVPLSRDVVAHIDTVNGFVHVNVRDRPIGVSAFYLGHLSELSPSSPVHVDGELAFGGRIADAQYGPWVQDGTIKVRRNPLGNNPITHEAVR